MKKLLHTLSAIFLMALSINSNAQSLKVLYYWDFNNSPDCGAGTSNLSPIAPDYSSQNAALTAHASLVLNQVTTPLRDSILKSATAGAAGSIYNERVALLGNDTTVGKCMQGNLMIKQCNPSSEDNFLWYLPTTGYQNIVLTYATQSSGSGPKTHIFYYSLDSGVTFTRAGLTGYADTTSTQYPAPDSALVTTNWSKVTINFSGIPAVNNNRKFVFKLVNDNANTTENGNDRFDNITLEGNIVSGIAPLENSLECAIFPNPAHSNLNITTPFDGTKHILVFNTMGQIVLETEQNGTTLELNTSSFIEGFYYVHITEVNGAKAAIMKFVKN